MFLQFLILVLRQFPSSPLSYKQETKPISKGNVKSYHEKQCQSGLRFDGALHRSKGHRAIMSWQMSLCAPTTYKGQYQLATYITQNVLTVSSIAGVSGRRPYTAHEFRKWSSISSINYKLFPKITLTRKFDVILTVHRR